MAKDKKLEGGTKPKSNKKKKPRKNKGRFAAMMKKHALTVGSATVVVVGSEAVNSTVASYRKGKANGPATKAALTLALGMSISGLLMIPKATRDSGYLTLAATVGKAGLDGLPLVKGWGNWIGDQVSKKDALPDESGVSKEVAAGSGGVNDGGQFPNT